MSSGNEEKQEGSQKMKLINKSLLVSSLIAAGLLLTAGTTVKADTINTNSSTSNNSSIISHALQDKRLITPVASNGNQTLREVAQANNDSLANLEKLNGNINPDKVIPNGTSLYLPQNLNLQSIFGVFITVRSGLTHAEYEKYYGRLSPAERAAKIWIAERESSLSYSARNGQNYGRFQLNISYLHGNYSHVNQERTADRYVKDRYGSWAAAKRFWLAHHWY